MPASQAPTTGAQRPCRRFAAHCPGSARARYYCRPAGMHAGGSFPPRHPVKVLTFSGGQLIVGVHES
jgi:hypothetical protein